MALDISPVDQIRSFNRFYTRKLGLLREGLLETPYPLTQARVLFEIAQQPGIRSRDILEELGLDAGYLSRMVKQFEVQGLLRRERDPQDRRNQCLTLTARGRKAFADLNARSAEEVSAWLAPLNASKQSLLIRGMQTVQNLLKPGAASQDDLRLRDPEPGDIGWVVSRHGELYAQEYGWDNTFEGLVAQIAGDFLAHHVPALERCWIAERYGERLGCIFVVRQSKTVAKLRLLLVEPSARGLGVGSALVEACIEFARKAGYRKMTLWTNDVLVAARKIYERAGFHLVTEEKHHSFGKDLTGQHWELAL